MLLPTTAACYQAAEDVAAGAAGAAKALPYAVALAAALSIESPFILVDSIVVRPRPSCQGDHCDPPF